MNWTPNVPQRVVLLAGSVLLSIQWYRAVDDRDSTGISVALVLILAIALMCAAFYKTRFKTDELLVNKTIISMATKTAALVLVVFIATTFARHIMSEISDLKFSVSWLERKEAKRIGLPPDLDPKEFEEALPAQPGK